MKKSHKRTLVVALISFVLAGSATAGYAWYSKAPEGPAGPTVEVKRGKLVETAAASGKIAPAVQVEVKSRASGEVAELLVKEGDVVEAGQLLLRLDKTDANRELAQAKVARDRAKADVISAQASVKVAELDKKNNKATQDLADKSVELGLGTSDAARVAAHSTNVSAANLTLKQAQANASALALQTAELAVQDAETQLKHTDIYAPIAGTILTLSVEKGTIVSSALTNVGGGSAVLTMADLSDLRIIGALDEAQISRVAPGQKVDIRVDAYPARVFEGTVDRVSPLGVETSSVVTFDVEIKVTDKEANLLRSGMSADVEIVTIEQADVLLVPLAAVQTKNRRRFVQLSSGEERQIETGSTDGTQMIVTKGLEEGDTILASAPVAAAPKSTAPQQGGQNPMRGMSGGNMGGRQRGGR
ncbi:MAG: efflux RND transporter periplasmic adaptor subunit [Polyangiaceae bacterium]|nr:efflux RND transporter periplasmic adaptor subunit [Polyangiaceae bacterium]